MANDILISALIYTTTKNPFFDAWLQFFVVFVSVLTYKEDDKTEIDFFILGAISIE